MPTGPDLVPRSMVRDVKKIARGRAAARCGRSVAPTVSVLTPFTKSRRGIFRLIPRSRSCAFKMGSAC
jgi:hypothetical protein